MQLLGDLPAGVAGHPVLLVDDIVDTRRSIAYAAAALHRCRIGELWTCALIDKPQRQQIEIAIDFVGFSVPDCSSSATAPITPRSIAICPISWRYRVTELMRVRPRLGCEARVGIAVHSTNISRK